MRGVSVQELLHSWSNLLPEVYHLLWVHQWIPHDVQVHLLLLLQLIRPVLLYQRQKSYKSPNCLLNLAWVGHAHLIFHQFIDANQVLSPTSANLLCPSVMWWKVMKPANQPTHQLWCLKASTTQKLMLIHSNQSRDLRWVLQVWTIWLLVVKR